MSDMICLNSDTPSVQYLCAKDKRLAKLIQRVGAISYTTYDDPYSFLVNHIIG